MLFLKGSYLSELCSICGRSCFNTSFAIVGKKYKRVGESEKPAKAPEPEPAKALEPAPQAAKENDEEQTV
jgi:hypothetical protein